MHPARIVQDLHWLSASQKNEAPLARPFGHRDCPGSMIRSRTTATPTCPTVREAERHSGGRGVPQGRDQRVPGPRRTPQDLWRNVILGAEHLERQFAHNAQRAPE